MTIKLDQTCLQAALESIGSIYVSLLVLLTDTSPLKLPGQGNYLVISYIIIGYNLQVIDGYSLLRVIGC